MTAPTLAPDSWQLVTRAQAGDTDAFAALYREHHDRVLRFIDHRVGSRHLAEDLAQDVWVRVLGRIGAVEYQGKDIAAWLMTIARNIATDHFKAARHRYTSVRTLDDLMVAREEPAADDDPEAETAAAIEARAAARLVGPLLAELTPEQQRVVQLRFYDGLSTVETAAAMGKNVGAVKAAQTRACASLRRALAVTA